jgi:hypothetical protein
MTILVSAFIQNMNTRKDINTSEYIEKGKILLKANIPKIIFIDENLINQFEDFMNENTKIIKICKNDIYLYEYSKYFSENKVITDNLDKDTTDYFCMMCSKTEWVRKAIEINYFKDNNYVWIDFGIRKIFKCDDNTFITKIERLNLCQYSKVRIASIWDLNGQFYFNKYHIMWFFAGGVFGGNKDELIKFADKMKQMCLRMLFSEKMLIWEVNIWYWVYKENPEFFDPYYCLHDDTIVDHY